MKKHRWRACIALAGSICVLTACSSGSLVGPPAGAPGDTDGNTNVSFGGASDFGHVRSLLDNNIVPRPEDLEAAGFFAEHHTPLPDPTCGERLCPHAMLGVMNNLFNGTACTLLQIGINSPIVVDPADRPPLTLGLAVDVSGSMAGDNKMGFVRDGLTTLIAALRDVDQVALVAYAADAEVRFPLANVGENRSRLLQVIAELEPTTSTNIYAGLEGAYQEVLGGFDPAREHRVILLSDGVATAGIVDTDSIIAMSSGYNSEGIGLTSIGVGTDFDPQLMNGLAEQANGNAYFLEDAAAVNEVFSEELSYFTVPVGFDVEISLELSSSYVLRNVYGTSLWETRENGGRVVIPSVFLAHRTSDDDVTSEGGRRGGGSALLIEVMPVDDGGETTTVGNVSLSFREPGAETFTAAETSSVYPHAATTVLSQGHFDNPIVTKSFVMLNIFVAIESSVTAFHAGQVEEAVAIVDRIIAAARDYEDSANGGEGDADIEADIALLEQLRAVELANGAQEPEDSNVSEDPWPAD